MRRKQGLADGLIVKIAFKTKAVVFGEWVEWLREAVWLKFEQRAWQAEREVRSNRRKVSAQGPPPPSPPSPPRSRAMTFGPLAFVGGTCRHDDCVGMMCHHVFSSRLRSLWGRSALRDATCVCHVTGHPTVAGGRGTGHSFFAANCQRIADRAPHHVAAAATCASCWAHRRA